MWILQNRLNYKSSPSDVYQKGTYKYKIEQVLVGTIGEYTPATTVSVAFPELDVDNGTAPKMTSEMPYGRSEGVGPVNKE